MSRTNLTGGVDLVMARELAIGLRPRTCTPVVPTHAHETLRQHSNIGRTWSAGPPETKP